MTNTSGTGKAPLAPYGLDEHEAAALARLADRYAGELPGIQQRAAARVPAVVHAGAQLSERFGLPKLVDSSLPAQTSEILTRRTAHYRRRIR